MPANRPTPKKSEAKKPASTKAVKAVAPRSDDAPRKARQFPVHSLETALVVIKAIGEAGAGKQMDRLLLAKAIGRTPASSEYKLLLSSSLKYGLTEGTEKADFIVPTQLGLRFLKPTSDEEQAAALRQAALAPPLLMRILQHYDRNRLPQPEFLKHALERSFSVPAEHTQDLVELLTANARFVGFLEDISGSLYIRLAGATPPALSNSAEDTVTDDEILAPSSPPAAPLAVSLPATHTATVPQAEDSRVPKQIFIAHGKQRQPLEQLQKVLDKFKIPYKVAVEEANAGRPISQKVAGLMETCTAAIFIFTKDEEFTDKAGDVVWRPSENVIYELGAAAVLYGTKIIIFKEDGVKFATDFQDLGYITFSPGEIPSKALDLLQELIALEFIKVMPI
jgi:predicted nucleotide-binding protein